MSRLLPPEAVQAKLAALQEADTMGRVMAHQQENIKLACVAGQLLAYELAKEAGLFSAVGRGVKAFTKAKGGRLAAAKKGFKREMKGSVGHGAKRGVKGGVPASKKAVPKAAPAAAAQKAPAKGTGWGRAALYGGAGAAAYGLYKGVPAAARALEASTANPMAVGGGWSPTPYGYGRTRYGPGMPTMGHGA